MSTKLQHRFETEHQYQNAVKCAEAAIPFYFAKLVAGGAIYLIEKLLWPQVSYYNSISMKHACSGIDYSNPKANVILLKWNQIPENYRMDMLSLVEEVRTYFGNLYTHTQNSKMNLSNKTSESLQSVLSKFRGRLIGVNSNGSDYDVYPDHFIAQPATGIGFTNPCKEIQLPYTDVDRKASSVPYSQISNNTNNNTMSFLNNIPGLSIDFGKYNSDQIALGFDMQPVFKSKEGGYVRIDEDKVAQYQGDLKFDVDFYKVPVQSTQLAVGDVILDGGQLLIVDENTKGDIKFIHPLTGSKTTRLVKNNLVGMYFYTKIVSLFSLGGDGSAEGFGVGGLNPMMLMLLSQKGEGINSSSDLLPLLLMGGQLGGAQANGQANLLPLLMMSGKGGSGIGDMLPLMLMSQGGNNPLGNLFGGQPVAKKAARKVASKRTVVATRRAPSTVKTPKKTVVKG